MALYFAGGGGCPTASTRHRDSVTFGERLLDRGAVHMVVTARRRESPDSDVKQPKPRILAAACGVRALKAKTL
jgi:hypothetical protein